MIQDRAQWNGIFNMLKGKKCQPTTLYPVKIFFTNEGKIRPFIKNQKLREFIAINATLQEMLKELSHAKE